MINKFSTVNYPIYKLVRGGSLSSPNVGDGRFAPALIINVRDDIEIPEWIKLHDGALPGDIELNWTFPLYILAPKSIILNIHVVKPMTFSFGIEISISNQYNIVEGIIQSRALYLMTGKSSDSIYNSIDHSLMLEVPDLEIDKKWDQILFKFLRKEYKGVGNSKKERDQIIREEVANNRAIWNFRNEKK
jgi:hypothetical protein